MRGAFESPQEYARLVELLFVFNSSSNFINRFYEIIGSLSPFMLALS
jgi:hypothetical protein